MKKIISLLLISSIGIISCNNGSSNTGNSNNNDSVDNKKMAKDSNTAKFDTSDMKKDAEFAVNAADGGMLEVKLGQLALKNGSSPEIKQMGQKMIDDHSKANDELKNLAQQLNITIPPAIGDKSQDKYNKLAKKMGKDFDKDYTKMMVDDHKTDVDDFKKEASDGKNADLKNWAAKTLPTLQSHLQMWNDIDQKMK